MQALFNAALFKQSDALLDDIKGHSLEERTQRLNVYRNNVHVSLQTALGDIFPVCKQWVGEDFFNAMAHQYIVQRPPKSPILSDYGDYFPDFVRSFLPAQGLPYLADVCQLEYQLLQITHQAEAQTLPLAEAQQRLSQVRHPDTLTLTLSDNCQLMHSPYAIGSLYLAHRQATPDVTHLSLQAPESLLLCKNGLYGCCYVLSAAEYVFLSALQNGLPLAQALPDDDTFELGQTLAHLMSWQVLSSIDDH